MSGWKTTGCKVGGTLAMARPGLHKFGSCGQSRSGGLVTSDGIRRSNPFGRVAVAYVQGKPKGGGALGMLEVTSTRLMPVPPVNKEALEAMTRRSAHNSHERARSLRPSRGSYVAVQAIIAVALMASPSMAHAQGIIGDILRAATRPSQQQATAQRDREEVLARISGYIRSNPDRACALPKRDIERYLAEEVDRHGLMSNVSRTVFNRGEATNAPSGYAALLEQTRQETARLQARNRAIYSGGEAPVGDQNQPVVPRYSAQLVEIKAVERIDNGLKCVADVYLNPLRFPVGYSVVLNPNEADGWTANGSFPTFTEAEALKAESMIRVDYAGALLPLAEARAQASNDQASAMAAREDARQRELAREAYARSPAGLADALRQRQAMVTKQKQCEANGGTWGVRLDGSTIMRVDASTVNGLFASVQGCFFLGR